MQKIIENDSCDAIHHVPMPLPGGGEDTGRRECAEIMSFDCSCVEEGDAHEGGRGGGGGGHNLLCVGDILQVINGEAVQGLSFAHQITLLKSSPRPLVLAFSSAI